MCTRTRRRVFTCITRRNSRSAADNKNHLWKGRYSHDGYVFRARVILGKTTFENVPKALKAGVAEVLIDSGLPELVPAEYGGTAA